MQIIIKCIKIICTKELPLIGFTRVTGKTKLIKKANISNVQNWQNSYGAHALHSYSKKELPTVFLVDILCSFRVMFRTIFKV